MLKPIANDDRRAERRQPVSAWTVRIGGLTSPLINLSACGFLAEAEAARHADGVIVEVTISIPPPPKAYEFNSRALVVRIDEVKQEIACEFIE